LKFGEIGLWLDDHWRETLSVVFPSAVLLVSVILSDEVAKKLFGKAAGGWQSVAFLLLVLLLIVSIVFHIKYDLPHRRKVSKLTLENDLLTEENESLTQDLRLTAEGYLMVLASNRLEFGSKDNNTERITLYIHSFEHNNFVLMGRYSSNPVYKTNGRRIYPVDQGCISRAWQNGRCTLLIESDPIENKVEYGEEQRQYGISQSEVDDLVMKSRFYFGYRIMGPDGHEVGVVIVESTDKERFNQQQLVVVFDDECHRNLSSFSERLRRHLPDPTAAKEKGF
tara:strand:- start:1939 stop:2781 length:843 start_codon:yes stop_codon:yes gene_type:complete